MELNPDTCYQALRAQDPRFDGVFFVGVETTGIYCRPVCTAKTPRPERCAYFRSAAAAERAGYRPCLRCRPELAPGSARVDAARRLATAAVRRIEDGALTGGSVAGLAAALGVTDRHLRRVLDAEFGVSPIELAQTQRLLLAKRLLTDTDLSVVEIAYASGFTSLRRFNALFRERYRLSPTGLRRRRGDETRPETLSCELAYRPPLDWEALHGFLAARACPGIEEAEGATYRRTVALGRHSGWIAVVPAWEKNALQVEVSLSLAPALRLLLPRLRRLFDLDAHPEPIAQQLGALAAAHPGLRVPGAIDGFEMAARAILEQQVSVQAAVTLAGRLAAERGEPISTPFPGLTRVFPAPERLAQTAPEALGARGIFGSRARAIIALAQAVCAGTIVLEPGVDHEATVAGLEALPGIGPWTAQYIALRALAWPDAFPHTDLGLRKALGTTDPRQALARAEAWRPWRGYAALHLWQTLEEKA